MRCSKKEQINAVIFGVRGQLNPVPVVLEHRVEQLFEFPRVDVVPGVKTLEQVLTQLAEWDADTSNGEVLEDRERVPVR